MARRRGFGEVERRVGANKVVTFRARYAMPDGSRFSRTLATRMDAEAWLATERSLIDRDKWTPPPERKVAEARRDREASYNTVKTFAERYLKERGLRPTTVLNYRRLLASRINPYFAEMPLKAVTLSEIKAWRASLNPKTEATNAAAYRLLRSLLQAAEEEELIDRAPPKVRGAGSAPVKRVAVPATLDEIAVVTGAMPERLRFFIVLAAFVGLRQGELLELRRCDIDGVTGRIKVSRKVDKDVVAGAGGACPHCGRVVSAPKTASGVRTVHVPPPFLPRLQKHLLEHTAAGPTGLLFPGDRTDHMSVRYLMDRYRPARATAGRPDLTIHHLRHTALTLAGQHGATAAELQARAGHASQAAMAIYQHATLDRDKRLADAIGETYEAWANGRN
ncbi:MAG: tyrosine-type recombinase/integrase [Nocardioidaceae bacterium]